jgi:fibronectin type 3 domain-containing protein
MNRLTRTVLVFGFFSLFVGCGEENPTELPGALDAPARPIDLVAEVAERGVSLRWDVSSEDGIDSYRVYRREVDASGFDWIAETAERSYADSGLVPGRSYDYRITSFGSNRIESEPSLLLTVTPGSFGLVINARAEYTASRQVTLAFTAPSDVNAVKIGSDSLLAGAFFEAYEPSRGWLLPGEDGEKRIYARFRTEGGVESPLVRDEIVLDTRASIFSIMEDSEGRVLGSGDTLRIEMRTGEAGGAATVTIGDAIVDEPLPYDASSGAYRLVRLITPDLSAVAEVAFGSFTDRAGNVATPLATTTTITLAGSGSPLEPVLLSTSGAGMSWVALTWEASLEPAFSRYVIFRASDPGISGDASDLSIGVVTDRFETGLVDSLLLTDSTAYYYRVFVEDRFGRRAGSNVAEATTRNRAPQGVGGFEAEPVDSPSTSIRLTWTAVDPSTVHDFESYAVYRSTSEAVSRSSEVVAEVGEILTRSLVDEGTEQATTYYYRIYVVDQGGLATGSDVVTATATDLDPSFVPLEAPIVDLTNQNVVLSWSASPDPDFASYEIYFGSSGTQGGVTSFTRLDIVNNREATGYVHYPEVEDLPLYVEYYLRVVDQAGGRTESNRVQAVFPAAPAAP